MKNYCEFFFGVCVLVGYRKVIEKRFLRGNVEDWRLEICEMFVSSLTTSDMRR